MSERAPLNQLIPIVTTEQSAVDFSYEREGEDELQEKDLAAFEKIDEIELEKKYEATAIPAMRLHLYNYLIKNPYCSYSDIKAELRNLQRLSDVELEYSNVGNPLPTIGIEVEGPQVHFTQRKRDALDHLDIPNEFQPQHGNKKTEPLWEINPVFTYSAQVQVSMLNEIVDFGVLPMDTQGKLDSSVPLSLHINLGAPESLSVEEMYANERVVILLNDTLIYAYTTGERIKEKKTPETLIIKGLRTQSSIKGENISRVELRTAEFKNELSSEQLTTAQRLAAAMFSFLKYKLKKPITFVEAKLADIWQEFEKEAAHYLETESMQPDHVGHDKDHVVATLQDTDLKYWSRFLAEDYSKKIGDVLVDLNIISKELEERESAESEEARKKVA